MSLSRFSVALAPLLASCVHQPAQYHDRVALWDETRKEGRQSSAVQANELNDDSGLHELLVHARAHNPGLESAFQRWKAALERVPQATALPDPKISFGAYLMEVETRVGPMQARVGASQALPWFGTLELEGDAAFAAAEEARASLEVARLELDHRVRLAWYEYAWALRALEINRGSQELLSHWEGVARVRMETGLGSHADVIRAQVELGKMEDRVDSLSDLRRPLRAELNAALHRDADAELPLPSFPLPEPPEFDGEHLEEALASANPMVHVLDKRIETSRLRGELAATLAYPDFVVGADYTFIGSARSSGVAGSGDDAFALTLGVDLPLWQSKYDAAEREAEARTRAAHMDRAEALNHLGAELQRALYGYRDANRRLLLYRDSLVPKGEESLRALDSGYRAGDQGFLDLIDAERILLEFQLQAARAETDRAKELANLERLTGLSLHTER